MNSRTARNIRKAVGQGRRSRYTEAQVAKAFSSVGSVAPPLPQGAPPPESSEEPPAGLEELGVTALKNMAKELAIKGYSRMKKEDLVIEIGKAR